MKKQLIILSAWIFCIASSAMQTTVGQNLVPNCSFEDTVACPDAISEISYAQGWSSFGGDSPDYFNACYDSPFYGVDVPVNRLGFQYAATGQAYAGIFTFINNPNNPLPGREWIGRELSEPLEVGQRYYVSFWTNFGGAIGGETRYAANKIGCLFSTIPYSWGDIPPVNNFAHVYTDSIITDTVNWVNVSGWITADSAYRYILLGNFFDNEHTDTAEVQPMEGFGAYYYIDNVCVSIDSSKCSCDTTTGLQNYSAEEIFISPNPTSGKVKIHCKEYADLKVIDWFGREAIHVSLSNGDNILSLSFLPTGQYIVIVNAGDKVLFRKILLTN